MTRAQIEQLRVKLELDLIYLRSVLIEPVMIQYDEHVSIDIRPDNDDARVSVLHDEWGFATVNYTGEGVIVDVADQGGNIVHTAPIGADELVLPED